MIIYLYKSPHRYTLEKFFITAWAPELSRRMRMVPYRRFLRWRRAPAATYIFSDIERLSVPEQERAASIWRQLRAHEPSLRLLNHPIASLKRFALLRSLREAGLNAFDVYRISERRRPGRFPVFIRSENEHDPAFSGLMETQAELDRAIAGLVEDGESLDDKIIVEYVDVSDREGFHHKYGDFCVGGRVISQHLLFTRDWWVKFADGSAVRDEHVRLEAELATNHPYRDQVAKIFEVANIGYGRIDYAVVDGRVQTFEINTNPHVLPTPTNEGPRSANRARFARELEAALLAIDHDAGPARIPLTGVKRSVLSVVRPVFDAGLYHGLRLAGALDREDSIRARLKAAKRRLVRFWPGRGEQPASDPGSRPDEAEG